MDQIKRVNNIWTNDSLFIKDYILIPLPLSPRTERSSSLTNGSTSHFTSSFDSSLEEAPHGHVISKQNIHQSRMSKSRSQDCVSPTTSKNSPPAKDFLSKFDNSLDKIKSNIQRLEQTTE